MQNEEKKELEERIIAYFDGSLNSEESSTLLTDVSKSAESRALFKGYESLQRIISASRVPMEMPMEAKRSIAERIPGLVAFIPGLLGGAQALPVITQSANPFIAFLSKIPLSTAISVGASAIVLTTAGVIVKNKLDDNAALDQKAKTAIVQNHLAQPSAQVYAELPKRDLVGPQVGHGSAVLAAAEVGGFAGQRTKGTEGTKGTHRNSNEASNIADVSTTNLANKQLVNAHPVNTPSVANDVAENRPVAKAADEQPASPAINMTASPRAVPAVAADIPVFKGSIFTPMNESFGEGITVRGYAGGWSRSVSLLGINAPNSSLLSNNFMAGAEFQVGDHYAFRIQAGRNSFAQVGYKPVSDLSLPAALASLTVKGPANEAQFSDWATLGISYSYPLTDAIPAIVSVDGGGLVSGGGGLMAILGLSTEIPLNSRISLRPGVTYDLVRSSIQQPDISNGVSTIYKNIVSDPSMISGSFGFQANLMYRF